MKKSLIILCCFLGQYVFGQFYIQPSIGYTFSTHPKKYEATEIIDNLKSVYSESVKYGEGMHLGLSFGYQFKSGVFIELNANQSISSKHSISIKRTEDTNNLDYYYYNGVFGDFSFDSTIFQLAPLFGYKITHKKYGLYLKLGPNFISSTIHRIQEYNGFSLNEDGVFYSTKIIGEYELEGNFNIGFRANLGVSYAIKPKLDLVLDITSVYNNYKLTKGELLAYSEDGVDSLNQIENTSFEYDDDDDRIVNYSHYGIHLGIRYSFLKN